MSRAQPYLPEIPTGPQLDELRDELLAKTNEAVAEFMARLTPAERRTVLAALERPGLLEHQRPPDGDWDIWLMLAGRGVGKTFAGAHWFDSHMSGPPCSHRVPGGHRAAIVAPTKGDAFESCVAGPSGLLALNPDLVTVTRRGGTYVTWPNGAEARLFGAYGPEDVERLRAGGNRCAVWCEELAAWPKLAQAWEHLDLGLRVGDHPRRVCTTTPRPKPLIKELVKDITVVVSHACTDDNPHLDRRVRARLYDRYGNTRLGRQELLGELLEDVPGALWTHDLLDRFRVNEADTPPYKRIVVAVDPAVSFTESSDETGIVVAALGSDLHGYVLGDFSMKAKPETWALKVVDTYEFFGADCVVAEVNNGGDLIESSLRAVEANLPYRAVRAKKNKHIRAEPVSMLYEQGKVHHVGTHPFLEDQLTGWSSEEDDSPDRLDALVYALTQLMLTGSRVDPVAVGPVSITSPSHWRPAR